MKKVGNTYWSYTKQMARPRPGQKSHQIKILHERRASHLLWVIWVIEVEGGVYFYLTRGKVRVRWNKSIQNFRPHMPILCRFVSVLKKSFIFGFGNYKCLKLRFKEVTLSPLTVFFHCTAKTKNTALKWYMLVLCMYFHNIYSDYLYLDNLKTVLKNYF